jgi:hypothetical protein
VHLAHFEQPDGRDVGVVGAEPGVGDRLQRGGSARAERRSLLGRFGDLGPSGIPLIQASRLHDELIVVHNLEIAGAREFELDDFNYEFDFREVHRAMTDRVVNEELPPSP